MNHEDHEKVTAIVLNGEFNDVHKWLDKYFVKYPEDNGCLHWRKRHHLAAIGSMYGNDEGRYRVAYLHIVCDLLFQLNLTISVPKNEEEITNILKEEGCYVQSQ